MLVNKVALGKCKVQNLMSKLPGHSMGTFSMCVTRICEVFDAAD